MSVGSEPLCLAQAWQLDHLYKKLKLEVPCIAQIIDYLNQEKHQDAWAVFLTNQTAISQYPKIEAYCLEIFNESNYVASSRSLPR